VSVVRFIAGRHLTSRRRQTAIAIVGMTLGVTALVTMTAIMRGFQTKFVNEVTRITAHVEVKDEDLVPERGLAERAFGPKALAHVIHNRSTDQARRIKRPTDISRAALLLPGVEAAAIALSGRAVASFGETDLPIDLRGIEPTSQDKVTPLSTYVTAGRYALLNTTPDGTILGTGVASKLGAQVGDRIMLAPPGGSPQSFKVVAILDTGIPSMDKTRIYLSLRRAQALLGKPDIVNSIGVRVADLDLAEGVARALESISGYKCESWKEANANFLALFLQMNTITGAAIGILIVVAGFGILSILMQIVMEKRRDISILRSVGFTRAQIQRIFLSEGLIIALVGAALGCGIAFGLVTWLDNLQVPMDGIVKSEKFLVDNNLWYYAGAAGFAIAAGVVASVVPARRAGRTEPVDVLRGQT
jgi:lipoprotein-releasing system permease protein